MRKAVDLLDSKKFSQLLDQLVIAAGAGDEVDMAVALDAVLEAADDGRSAPRARLQPIANDGTGKGLQEGAARVHVDADSDDTPESIAKAAAAADAMAAATLPREVVVKQVIDEVVVPAYKAGHRCFLIPLLYKNRRVSVSNVIWGPTMRQSGIAFNELQWVYDQRTWQGQAPTPGLNQPLVLQ